MDSRGHATHFTHSGGANSFCYHPSSSKFHFLSSYATVNWVALSRGIKWPGPEAGYRPTIAQVYVDLHMSSRLMFQWRSA
jgi:hypothetical protein